MPTIGLDIGGTTMTAVVLDGDDRVLERADAPRPRSAAAMRSEPIDLVHPLCGPQIDGIGIGVAGLVDAGSGTLVWGPNVAGEGIGFRSVVEASLGLPVFVDNDANLAALAEVRIGAARGRRLVLLLTLGTGIGGGWIVDGQVFRGRGFAGEIGHMQVDPDGLACTCGGSGCWETVCSGRRLDELARELAGAGLLGDLPIGRADGAALTDAALAGNDHARAHLAGMGRWLGRGIANLIAALDPEIVVVGGGASAAGPVLLDAAIATVTATLEGAQHRTPTPIVTAALGAAAGAVGAAIYARESLA